MSDLISRQAAIDAINKAVTKEAARWSVKELPSEPVGNSEQLDRTCAKCKHYTADGICVQWSRYGFREEDYCSRWKE